MPISINWSTKVISIPQNYLTFISGVLYELDVDQFRKDLKDLEDGEGIAFVDTHRHNTQVTLSGVTYARTFEVINGFTVSFADGQYVVRCVGANHNLADVKVANQVSLIVGNAAGLISVGSGLSQAQNDALLDAQAEAKLVRKVMGNRQEIDESGTFTIYDDDDVTPLQTHTVTDKDGYAINLKVGVPARRGPPT